MQALIRFDSLTPYQDRVVRLVLEGLTSEEIGLRLNRQGRSAGRALEQIMERAGFRNRVQLALWAAAHLGNPYSQGTQKGTTGE